MRLQEHRPGSCVKNKPGAMPDVAKQSRVELTGRIDRVGMNEIEVPVCLRDSRGQLYRVPARAKAFVSLDDVNSRGIHMSRLFLLTQEALQSRELDFNLIRELLAQFVASHQETSLSAELSISFDYMVERPALVSEYRGWRTYPVTYSGVLSPQGLELDVRFQVVYSSTCPCSAALARQIVQGKFRETFAERKLNFEDVHAWLGTPEGMAATPHSQRSFADVRLRLAHEASAINVISFIDSVEKALGTPVQAAVKREDEQEFARLNAQNLMFCEDAARKIFNLFNANYEVKDFYARVDHVESLHPHNAVAVITKGIPGGFEA